MITVRYWFYVKRPGPCGQIAEERTMDVDFETDDEEHALELAERSAEFEVPANAISGTVQWTIAD